MLPRARIMHEPSPVFPAFPVWARTAGPAPAVEEAAFFAGAGLATLHPLARDPHPLGRLWRQRLALGAGASLVRQMGRTEDAAALRDSLYLRRPGDDPGPAGKILCAFRKLGEPAALKSENWPPLLAEMFGLRIDGAYEELMAIAVKLSKGGGSPVAAAAEIAATSLRLRPDCEMLALWLADAVLAVKLSWPAAAPLLAGHLPRHALRAATHHGSDAGAWFAACCLACARAAAEAAGLHADLARRSAKLIAAAPKLRSKDASDMIARLLTEDAQPAAGGKTTSQRSARRLFDRLEALGAIRELTGRPTFRLYGL